MFRPVANGNKEKGAALQIPDIEISTLKVTSNSNEVVGKSIADCQLRKKYHVTLLAIKRNEVYLTDIDIATQIETDDILFVFGRPEHIAAFNKLIEA